MARLSLVVLGCAVVISGIIYLTCHVFADSKGLTANRNIVATAIIFRHGEKEGIQVPRGGSLKSTSSNIDMMTLTSNNTEEVQCRICDNELLGLLTKKGIGQMYHLGDSLRSKYEHLLPQSGFFDPSTMGIISSAISRTIMSLESFMAGFLPPPEVHGFLPISWQPFTFNIDYTGEFVYVNFQTKSCPKFYKLLNDLVLAKPPVSKWLKEDQPVIKNLTMYYGYPINNFFDFVFMIDQLRIELHNSEPWLVEAFKKTLVKYITDIYWWLNFSPEMIRIRSGVLLTQVVKNMLDIAAKTTTKNILIYSGHDLSVYSLACALGVDNQLEGSVQHGDTIMVDLIQRGDKEPPEVEVIYLKRESGSQIILQIPECGQPCYLSGFVKLTKDMMVDDYQEICKL